MDSMGANVTRSELTVGIFAHSHYMRFMYLLQQLEIINEMSFAFETPSTQVNIFEMDNFVPMCREPQVFISFYTKGTEL